MPRGVLLVGYGNGISLGLDVYLVSPLYLERTWRFCWNSKVPTSSIFQLLCDTVNVIRN